MFVPFIVTCAMAYTSPVSTTCGEIPLEISAFRSLDDCLIEAVAQVQDLGGQTIANSIGCRTLAEDARVKAKHTASTQLEQEP